MEERVLTEKEVDQKIENATFIVSKTVVDMLTELKEELKDDLIVAVENKIETKVNGKIKEIAHTLEAQNTVLKIQSEKLDELKPILENYRDREGTKRFMAQIIKYVIGAAGVIGALYVIKDFLVK